MADERPRTSPARHRCRSTPASVRSRSAPAFRRRAGRRRCSSPRASASWRGAGESPVGEIDIVARRRASAGVRRGARRARRLDDAAWSVTERQRARIVAAARGVARALSRIAAFSDIRFDAMLVAPGRLPRHIPAAFDASM